MFSRQIYNMLRQHVQAPVLANASRCFSSEAGEHRIEKTINQVTLLGRAGAEAKRGGSEERPVVYFSLATQLNYKSSESGDFIQKTEWHRVVVFKPTLRDTVYNFLKKGQRVYVAGKLSYGEITDASGQTKPTTAIVADDVIFFNTGRSET